ncbi:MAG: hormogonium polysaccharide biosynthesis protein HpsA [Coleofasciculus sp. A1-SPW-01]|uniref:hormogonium polysaccharide biosynthesis protein HpsA n=1 Tax=Coleofasciculus sp. A1-SPW-01 TaxID=3070819 RepID=UPI0033055A7C
MSTSKKLVKTAQHLCQQISRIARTVTKTVMQWFLRRLFILKGHPRQSQAGFLLPTVTMVVLVVVLLTTAIVFRSFDRTRNASNVRIDRSVMAAATPALDRAQAKIEALFDDPTLPRATPSDTALYNTFQANKYTLPDETRLKLAYDFGDGAGGTTPNNTIDTSNVLEQNETLNTAWRFPVDTDGNGKFDSYTLYGIYSRNPTRNPATGDFNRARKPLEARTPPMDDGVVGGQCAAALGTSASLVGDSDWFKSGSNLKKSIFVYVATVPIQTPPASHQVGNAGDYEPHVGNKGFSALEQQQDRALVPLSNNAVWFQDDVQISNLGGEFALNGRVFTNSNLLAAGAFGNKAIFRQVSAPTSCYYNEENGKMLVGGNVANGGIDENSDGGLVEVHRFNGLGVEPTAQNVADGIKGTNKTTTSAGGSAVGYNTLAYAERISQMVDVAFNDYVPSGGLTSATAIDSVAEYPDQVKTRYKERYGTNDADTILREELELYFIQRTRRVPFAEVAFGTDAFAGVTKTSPFGATNPVRPPDAWMSIASGDTGLTLQYLKATLPEQQEQEGKEFFIGDRIIAGNNLPPIWAKFSGGSFDSFAEEGESQEISGQTWFDKDGNDSGETRTRQSQIEEQPDLGNIDRNGFWENEAVKQPAATENSGGLRIVTGAGIYYNSGSTAPALSAASFLPRPADLDRPRPPGLANGVSRLPADVTLAGTPTPYQLVWPDTMPMTHPDNPVTTGVDESTQPTDLRMRATAVYHYEEDSGKDQLPIACVSSYFDPTNATTAQNNVNADGGYGIDATNGKSNNGVSYPRSYSTRSLSGWLPELRVQAAMMFPNGRLANPALHKALSKMNSSGTALSGETLTMADYSAVDAAVCSIRILTEAPFLPNDSVIPHGTIKEAAFLDAREVKSLNRGSDETEIASTNTHFSDAYDLPIEQRQPLEIRVTEIDLNLLRTTGIGTASNSTANDPNNDEEFLLPNSGIIYATREDALPDRSATITETDDSATTNIDESGFADFDESSSTKLVSPTDFKLDPTRRPNGIRLINGIDLSRKSFYRIKEKGLILVSNLPVYIKGDLNEHDFQEFTTGTTFYDRTGLEDDFACRPGQAGCGTTGDKWRPTTIISDAVTLLSGDFRDGFRQEGDYDLRNNAGNSAVTARLQNGFWWNNFVTNAAWDGDGDGYPDPRTSYLTNGVTPIQRRAEFPEYLMEVCPKVPVSECGSTDWYINPSAGTRTSDITTVPVAFNIATHPSGTTAQGPAPALQGFPRRIAFRRDVNGELVNRNGAVITNLSMNGVANAPVPMGITGGNINDFPYYDASGVRLTTTPDLTASPTSTWFWITDQDNPTLAPGGDVRYNDTNLLYLQPGSITAVTDQPGLVPMLQIHSPQGTPGDNNDVFGGANRGFMEEEWLQIAPADTMTRSSTIANAAFVSGDSPGRPSESGGGLPNFVRFLENWGTPGGTGGTRGTVDPRTAEIDGSFIQTRKSAYATSPIMATNAGTSAVRSLFYGEADKKTYRGGANNSKSPFYAAPNRQWGFDVGLLTQLPDLFAQRFTTPPAEPPNEYFREVGRDDPWIQTLLCAGAASDRLGTASGVTFSRAIDNPPSDCPTIPNNS